MKIKCLKENFSVCKLKDFSHVNWNARLYFLAKTEEENSLVCVTENVPENTTDREDGWRGFRIEGVLDFSLVGVLSTISSMLAKAQISIFAVSTYNTDYIFVKEEKLAQALELLRQSGYQINE